MLLHGERVEDMLEDWYDLNGILHYRVANHFSPFRQASPTRLPLAHPTVTMKRSSALLGLAALSSSPSVSTPIPPESLRTPSHSRRHQFCINCILDLDPMSHYSYRRHFHRALALTFATYPRDAPREHRGGSGRSYPSHLLLHPDRVVRAREGQNE